MAEKPPPPPPPPILGIAEPDGIADGALIEDSTALLVGSVVDDSDSMNPE